MEEQKGFTKSYPTYFWKVYLYESFLSYGQLNPLAAQATPEGLANFTRIFPNSLAEIVELRLRMRFKT